MIGAAMAAWLHGLLSDDIPALEAPLMGKLNGLEEEDPLEVPGFTVLQKLGFCI